MRRTEARELFMQLLFQMEVQKDYSEEEKVAYTNQYMNGSSQLDYFNRLFSNTVNNLKEIDEKIEFCSDHWKTTRMAKVDLAILRLATAEILYFDDIPVGASINEAVDMAKKFGGEDSGKFVNGILGKIAKERNV